MNATPRLQLFTTRFCGFCVAAKRLLAERGVPYEEIDLSGDPVRREEISRRYGWMTVPVIVADGELIGGFDELSALDRERGLDHLK